MTKNKIIDNLISKGRSELSSYGRYWLKTDNKGKDFAFKLNDEGDEKVLYFSLLKHIKSKGNDFDEYKVMSMKSYSFKSWFEIPTIINMIWKEYKLGSKDD